MAIRLEYVFLKYFTIDAHAPILPKASEEPWMQHASKKKKFLAR
jgi:hypothetical protein